MTDANPNKRPADLGGVAVAVAMIIVGAVSIWDTTTMTDSDSYVFPRAIAIVMMLLSAIYIARQIISPVVSENSEAGIMGGSYLRRAGLIIAMIGSALLMPWVGFMISGLMAFGFVMLLAMYDEWTPRRRIVFPLTGLIIVVGFYFLFSTLLSVPLPEGSFFD